MTNLKQRAAEIAAEQANRIYMPVGSFRGAKELIESALLQFAREVLAPQREKDAAVMQMTAKLCALPEDNHGRISRESVMELVVQWRSKWGAAGKAMTAELAKELEDG